MKKLLKVLFISFVLLCAAAGLQYWSSPARLVDIITTLGGGNNGINWSVKTQSYGALARQKLDIWTNPADKVEPANPKKPVLVFFYGGGWNKGSRLDYGFVAKAYSEKGFLVVLPDYRLVPEVRFPGFVADSALAIKWVQANIARYGGDPDRIVVAGHSAGAYNALMVALDPQWLGDKPVRAAVSLAGPADFYPFDKPSSIAAMGQAPNPLATQPVHFVRKDAPPILLMHGSSDSVVRIRNAESLFAKQRAVGGDIQLRRFPGSSHNDLILAVAHNFHWYLPVLDESAAFLLEHSKVRARVGS